MSVAFLGQVLDKSTKSTKQGSVACIRGLQKLYNIHLLGVFLGLAGNFHMFIKDYTTKTRFLTVLMRMDTHFHWREECKAACHFLVDNVPSDSVLMLLDLILLFELKTDASYYGTRAIFTGGNTTIHKDDSWAWVGTASTHSLQLKQTAQLPKRGHWQLCWHWSTAAPTWRAAPLCCSPITRHCHISSSYQNRKGE